MGVVVRRYIDIQTPLVLALFLAAASLLLCSFFKMFFHSLYHVSDNEGRKKIRRSN